MDMRQARTPGLLTGFSDTSMVGRTWSILVIFLEQERASILHCHAHY